MYTEQLAVLLFIAATHMPGQANGPQAMLQMPHNGKENIALQTQPQWRLAQAGKQRSKIRQEREAMMLAQFY